jgi:hypothetical protein
VRVLLEVHEDLQVRLVDNDDRVGRGEDHLDLVELLVVYDDCLMEEAVMLIHLVHHVRAVLVDQVRAVVVRNLEIIEDLVQVRPQQHRPRRAVEGLLFEPRRSHVAYLKLLHASPNVARVDAHPLILLMRLRAIEENHDLEMSKHAKHDVLVKSKAG